MVRRPELMVIATLLGILTAACGAGPGASGRTAAPLAGGPTAVLPDGFEVAVEVASDPDTRARGLMFRTSVPEGRGMLFLFTESGVHSFWMKNTLVPLDIIWIDERGLVVDVQAHVPPCEADPCPSYEPAGDSRYVLELGAGQAERHGVYPRAMIRMRELEQYIVR